jgi:hypothetical protein
MPSDPLCLTLDLLGLTSKLSIVASNPSILLSKPSNSAPGKPRSDWIEVLKYNLMGSLVQLSLHGGGRFCFRSVCLDRHLESQV